METESETITKHIMKFLITLYLVSSLITIGLFGFLIFDGLKDCGGAEATIIVVDSKGGGNYTSIQAAVNNANTGDTIKVWAGTYYENLIITKRITLIGNGTTNTTINGGGNGDVLYISAGWVNVTGFNITGSGFYYNDAGIELNYVENCSITNTHCSGNEIGIYLYYSNNNTIKNNSGILNNAYCIYLKYSHSNNIINNSCTNNQGQIIDLFYSNRNVVDNNNCSNNKGIGIDLSDSNFNTITNNTCSNNFYVWLNIDYGDGIGLYDSDSNTIINNNCLDNGRFGIDLWWGSDSNNIINNTSSNNTYGMELYCSCSNKIANNTVNWNDRKGIFLNWHCNSNTMVNNTCKYNSDDGIFITCSESCIIKKNTLISCGFNMDGDVISTWNTHTIDINNTINGKPVYYWKNLIGGTVPYNASMVIITNCQNVIVENQNCSDKSVGIIVAFSNTITIRNNTFNSNIHDGIFIWYSDSNTIINNTCSKNNCEGIHLAGSDSNNIINNDLFFNKEGGVSIWDSSGAVIRKNTMVFCGFYFFGDKLQDWNTHTIDVDNNVNGKPVFYWKNVNGGTIPNGGGQVILAGCSNIIIENDNYDYTSVGIMLGFSNNITIGNNTCNFNTKCGIFLSCSCGNTIINNSFSSNIYGIRVMFSDSNTIINNICNSNIDYGIFLCLTDINKIVQNNISDNEIGVCLFSFTTMNNISNNIISNNDLGLSIDTESNYNNTIFHNNIINNFQQANFNEKNLWNNNRQEGNYWSDYDGLDNGFFGRVLGDGIGDTNFPHLDLDYYPFIEPFGWILPTTPILSASDKIDTDGEYTLSWNPTYRTIGYILEEAENEKFDDPTIVYNGLALTFKIKEKNNGTYYYRLKAYNEYSSTDWSNILNVTVDWLPEIPQNLTVTVYPEGNALNLSWSLNLVGTKEYVLHYKTTGPWMSLGTITHPNNTYNHTNLQNEKRHYYRLQAKDFRGQLSAISNTVDAIPVDSVVPAPPTGFTTDAISDTEINLTWDANSEPDLAGYLIYMNNTINDSTTEFHQINTIFGQKTSYTVFNLIEQTTYYFKIKAFDERPNTSPFSNMVTATTLDVTQPSAPTGLKIIKAINNSLTISWHACPESDVVGYIIYRSLSSQDLYTQINSKLIIETQYVDPGLKEGTTYYYKLKAIDDAQLKSDFSDFVAGKTILSPYPPKINEPVINFELLEDSYDDQSINLLDWFIYINNDPLNFRCEGQENIKVKIFQTNGTVILKPKHNWNGKETLTFYANDSIFEVSDNVTIIVTFVNDPPGLTEIIQPKDGIRITEGNPLDFKGSCDDPDIPYGDKFTFKWSSSISGELGKGENLTGIILTPGKHMISLEVLDSYGKEAISTFVKVYIEEKSEPHESDTDINISLIAAIICIIIVIIIILLLFFKKKTGNHGPCSGLRAITFKPKVSK